MGEFYGDDGWEPLPPQWQPAPPRRRRASPQHVRSDYANPWLDPSWAGGHYRSLSMGNGPAPTVNIRMYQDNENKSRSPLAMPPYPTSSSRHASPRASPEGRSRGRSRSGLDRLFGEDLITAELANMALEHRHNRSRSRGRSHGPATDRTDQIALAEYQLRELSREKQARLDEERIRHNMKREQYERDKERDERDSREKRLVEEAQRKAEYERDKREAEKKALIAEHDRKQWEKEEERKAEEKRVKEKMQREAREAEEKEEKQKAEWKRQEKEEQEEEKRKEAEYERKRVEKEAREKKEKEEAARKFQADMRDRLRALGYTEQMIDVMVDDEKNKAFAARQCHERVACSPPRGALVSWEPATRGPVYPKIRKDFLEIKTLEYYQLPWHYDHSNPDYIIIRRDLDKSATDLLFEHTRDIRTGGTLLLEPKKDKKYAMFRRRSKSRHRAREIGVVRLG